MNSPNKGSAGVSSSGGRNSSAEYACDSEMRSRASSDG